MLELRWIQPGEIKSFWDLVKPGLERVAKTADAWIPEDIYMAIKNGSVNLHIGYDNGYKGFIVTQQQDAYGEVTLHVWAGYSEGKDFNLLEQSTGHLKEWAQAINAQKITFSTTRKGWAKQAIKLGFKPTLQTYELTL